MPKTVVLIDDDPDDLFFMREALDKIDSSLVCFSFTDPEEALKTLTKELVFSPDYIFIDINMPMMTGYDCLRELRKSEGLQEACIIIYSTYLPPSEAEKLKKQGATYAFQKPYKAGEYLSILKDIIKD
jgi:CheY-like chemotaxis protein